MLTRSTFQDYFQGRFGYQLADDVAHYGNMATGVYFSFSFCAPDPKSRSERPTVLFRLNAIRN